MAKLLAACLAWSSSGFFPAPVIGAVVGSPQPLQQVISYAYRIGNSGQGRVHCADADKKARVHDIEVVEFVGLAVGVQYGSLRVRAEPACPGLMGTAGDRDVGFHIDVARDQVRRM